jgi:hypothetical protein
MCLLKVYLDKKGERSLIAKDVALVVREGNEIKLRSSEIRNMATLQEVDIYLVDTLNSIMVVKPRT